jgi:transposase
MAYSMGATSSRTIDKLCSDSTTFMVLSGFSQPKKSKIADFVSQLSDEIESIFVQVLAVCYEMGLIGVQMFAIDGCKLPSKK